MSLNSLTVSSTKTGESSGIGGTPTSVPESCPSSITTESANLINRGHTPTDKAIKVAQLSKCLNYIDKYHGFNFNLNFGGDPGGSGGQVSGSNNATNRVACGETQQPHHHHQHIDHRSPQKSIEPKASTSHATRPSLEDELNKHRIPTSPGAAGDGFVIAVSLNDGKLILNRSEKTKSRVSKKKKSINTRYGYEHNVIYNVNSWISKRYVDWKKFNGFCFPKRSPNFHP